MNGEVLQLLLKIFEVCVIPLLSVLTGFLIKYINVKSAEILARTENETLQKYISMLTNTIEACVLATNQTYVDSLKEQGTFDAEAQKKAFEMTSEAVLNILNADAKEYLESVYGDLSSYIAKQIEATVKLEK